MKKLLIAISLISIIGCDAHDGMLCMNSVTQKYPEADVRPLNSKYRFMVKRVNGEIRYVETMNQLDTRISSDTVLFKAVN